MQQAYEVALVMIARGQPELASTLHQVHNLLPPRQRCRQLAPLVDTNQGVGLDVLGSEQATFHFAIWTLLYNKWVR